MSVKTTAPKKITKREMELRKLIGEEDHKRISEAVKAQVIEDNAVRTRVDPHLKNSRLSLLVGKLFFTKCPEGGADYAMLSSHLLYHIKNDSVSDTRKMFAAIIRMKTEARKAKDKKPARFTVASNALKTFQQEHKDGSWTAIDFNKYLVEQTKDMEGVSFPPLKKRQSWTRLNARLGISDKVKRTGKALPKKAGKKAT
jgi:hypothetical protein